MRHNEHHIKLYTSTRASFYVRYIRILLKILHHVYW